MTLFSIAGIPPIVGFLAGIFLVVVKSSAYLVSCYTFKARLTFITSLINQSLISRIL
jgi:NADH:ubiquinone oxidoreductase subunit 2 (subunit N)